jgi:hypothetical protein
MSMKNSNDTIGNRTRDLPACAAVLQQIAPPVAPYSFEGKFKFHPRAGHEGLDSFFNTGARWECVVNATIRPLYPWEKSDTHL